MKKRILSILLALVMALSLLPTTVLAANEEPASVKYGTYGSSTVWTEDEKCAGSIVYEDKGVKLSKVATPTANDNEYEITLTVETTTTSSTTAASAATVLVIDTSGSMDYCAECGNDIGWKNRGHTNDCKYKRENSYESRMDAAKAAAKAFLAAYSGRTKNSADTLNYGRYLAIVPFSTNVGTTTGWLDVSNKADYDEADRAINNLNANGGTNLERGLYTTANEKLKDNAVKDISYKNVIALTDGEPTYYGTTPNGGGSYCDGDTYKATINTATALKENATLYTVCFGVADDWMKKEYHDGGIFGNSYYVYWDITVGDYLEIEIATSEDHAYNAADADELNEAFESITETITSGISAGTVNDPLPAGVVVTAGIGYAKTWELDPDDAERTVEGNTTTYTYTKTYTVTIDPGQVVDGTDYQPLNGKTTFTSGDTVLEFPVPAGKVTPITYTVKYEYTGTVPADATELPGEDTCRYGDTVTVAAGATATGYTFSGWTTSDADIEDGRFTMPNKDVTLTGSFTINNYTVTYRVDDKTYGSPESYNYGADVTVAQTPSEEGYTFNGWTTEDVTVTSGKFTMPDKDVTLSGKFSPRTDLSYTVNYLEQSTNKVLADAKTVTGQTFGASVTETAIDITGYTKVDPISATIAIGVENNVINFYYALSATPLDPTTFGVKYFVEYYLEDAETGAFVKDETRSTIKAAEVTRDGTTTVTETPAVIEGYAFDVEKSSISGTVKLPKSDADIVTLKLFYGIDNWNDKEDKDDKGDGIPDYKQVRLLYTATTGGSVDPTISIITLSETTGNVTDAGSTATAKSGYQFDKWTREDTTVATTATTGEITIANAEGGETYTFTANFRALDSVPIYVYARIMKNGAAITDTELADVAAAWGIDLTENDNGNGWLTIGMIENVPALQGVAQPSADENVYSTYRSDINTSNIVRYTANAGVDISWITFHSLKGNQDGAIDYAKNQDGTPDYSVKTWHLDGVINVYSVTYTDGVDGEEVFADKTTNYVRAGEKTPAFGETPSRDGYVFVGWDKEVAETVTENVIYTAQWEGDDWKDAEQTSDPDDKDSTTGGDGIPDKYQVLIQYVSTDENQGTVSPTQEVLTIAKGDNDNYLTAGTVVASGSTATADKNYTFKKWTNDFGAAEIKNAKTGEIVIEAAKGGKTYTFTANFASNPTPYNPPVAPKLNKADHYAYVVGYPDGTVQPQGAITRAEVATIFFRLLSDETRDLYWTKDNGYTDVKAGDWFNNAVSTLSNAGIINGYPDGTFRPNAPITRAEMAKVIAMFAELNKDSAGFKDIAGHWAEAYIKLAAGNGWIAGYPDGTFRPDQDITRAETMTMINRVLERVPSTEKHLLAYEVMLTFPDNQPGDWYYIAVQEATNSHTYERYATEKNGDEQWIKLIDNYDWTKLEF